MKKYQGEELVGLPTGWYWAKRHEFLDMPVVVFVSSKEIFPFGMTTEIQFGDWPDSFVLYADMPDKSDDCAAILYGPIEVPNF